MLEEKIRHGSTEFTHYVLTNSDGVLGSGLRLRRKHDTLPKHRDSPPYKGHHVGPSYAVTVGSRATVDHTSGHTIELSERQMTELFFAWQMLRKEYADTHPHLAEKWAEDGSTE